MTFHGARSPSNITSAHEELLNRGGGFASGNGDKLGGFGGLPKCNIVAVFRE